MRTTITLNPQEYANFKKKIAEAVGTATALGRPLDETLDNYFGNNRDKDEPGRIIIYPIGEQP